MFTLQLGLPRLPGSPGSSSCDLKRAGQTPVSLCTVGCLCASQRHLHWKSFVGDVNSFEQKLKKKFIMFFYHVLKFKMLFLCVVS